MRAMILAAGEGTRLRPLTLRRPKPMMPVVNRPNIAHVLDKLAHAGIHDAAINLCFHGEQIESFIGNGKNWLFNIRFSHEKEVRGTAGSLAPLKDFFREGTFVVLSGDGVSEIDLAALQDAHRRSGCVATIVLKQVDARFEYGLVKLNGSQRVSELIEKPRWRDAFAPYVNTGIYMFEPEILNLIPDSGTFDFARDLYPLLLAQNKPVGGYIFNGYWCDIGNLREYRCCHKDILDEKVKVQIPGCQIEPGVWVGEKTKIAKSTTLRGPIAIGRNVTIKRGARILPYSVIGDNCEIGADATISESILWESVHVSNGVHVSGCVLADHARIKENIAFYEGAILSAHPE